MANRHKRPFYAGGNSNVAKEAQARASGGRVYYAGGGSNVAKEAAEKKRGGKITGAAPKARLDKRARGGKVGSDKKPMAPGSANHPFSSAKMG